MTEQELPVVEEKRHLPPWLIGLILAAIIFVIGLIVVQALGFGDNPVLEQAMDSIVAQ